MPTKTSYLALLFACFQSGVSAEPTWPASTDELEDMMYLNSGYRARGFATPVSPCSKGLAAGRITAAEWLRTAFHDAISGNYYTGIGGLDGSIQFELASSENNGNAFPSSVAAWAPFFSNRTSFADIVAASVYTVTRSCGGPTVPVRGGHVDATSSGPTGFVPQPQNDVGTFKQQFARLNMNSTSMIQIVACGHTLGGVHASDNPLVVDSGAYPNDFAVMDSTASAFDTTIASEYVKGTTKNPLVIGKSISNKRNSDGRVFASDSNVTIAAMQDAQTFSNACRSLFQQMIEIVPAGVVLSDPVSPYQVKPYDVQLTLLDGGSNIRFTGDIRVRTTQRNDIAQVQLVYKDRTGTVVSTPIDTTQKGTASGFDDTFSFFGFSADIPAAASISSFNVLVNTGGSSQTFDNNGAGFGVEDTIIYQAPQSCLDTNGKLTVVAAVRNSALAPSLKVVVKTPQASPNPVPSLSTATVAMAKQSAVGSFQLYSADFMSGSLASAMYGVFAGQSSDTYKNPGNLPTACAPLALPSSSSAAPTSSPASTSSASTLSTSTLSASTLSVSTSSVSTSSSVTSPASTSSASTSSSASSNPSMSSTSSTSSATPVSSEPTFAGYKYVGCLSDAPGNRTLTSRTQSTSDNTYAVCASFCSGYQYFGVEYSSECYCGNVVEYTIQNPSTDCSMQCSGDPNVPCGGPARLTTFESDTPIQSPTNPAITNYTYAGCYTDNVNARVLDEDYYRDSEMTVEKCASHCVGYTYFGTEYGEECFCGEAWKNPTQKMSEGDCGFLCAGDSQELCGAGNRLSLYQKSL